MSESFKTRSKRYNENRYTGLYEYTQNKYREQQAQSLIGKQCCGKDETKMIFAHGEMLDQVIQLPSGYTVIFLAKFGETIRGSIDSDNELMELYTDGNTLFDGNDTIPRLSQAGGEWVKDHEYLGIQPLLFVGRDGQACVNGKPIDLLIPDINIQFFGSSCNNVNVDIMNENEAKQIHTDKHHCYIKCVGDQTENRTCDKYHGKTVRLKEILMNEGPGTYIVNTCLSSKCISREVMGNSRYALFLMSQYQYYINEGLIPEDLEQALKVFKYSYRLDINNKDKHPDCNEFALQGRCDHPDHSEYMHRYCPDSCSIIQEYLTKLIGETFPMPEDTNMMSYGTSYFGKKKTKKINLELTRLQKKAKKLKIRITKKTKGKRIYKTITELKKNINKLNKKNKFGGRGKSTFQKNKENQDPQTKVEFKKRENKGLGNHNTLQEAKKLAEQQDNLVSAVKMSIITPMDMNGWTISHQRSKNLAGEPTPRDNNLCRWQLMKSVRRLNIYKPLVGPPSCHIEYGENAIRSIHYTYINNVGGHVSFEAKLHRSQYNIHFGFEQNTKLFGFWNVHNTLRQLKIKETLQQKEQWEKEDGTDLPKEQIPFNLDSYFLKSKFAQCMIDCWEDFNGYLPSIDFKILS